jgi:UDPglucose 6-dehydrogenase
VGTPSGKQGEADLSALYKVVEDIGRNLNGYKVIMTKSTVPVGTNRKIKEKLIKDTGKDNFDVVSNPEFLREGKAVQDFFHPDRIVVGCETEKAKKLVIDIYRALYLIQVPFVFCNLETAELIKYAGNAFLATKITFINQLANLAEAVGADIHLVAKAMGMDGRISSKFLHPGPGFGGSCFPKDVRALSHTSRDYHTDLSLIDAVISANQAQKMRMVEKVKSRLGSLKNKTIAILGLAFKAETDDVRESPAITIVEALKTEGARIKVHDPQAIQNFKNLFPDIEYSENEFDAIKEADALIICTEWNEYRSLDLLHVKKLMRGRYILDTRNVLDNESVKNIGFHYEGVGRI